MPDEVAIPIEMKTGSSKYYRTRPPSIGGGGGGITLDHLK